MAQIQFNDMEIEFFKPHKHVEDYFISTSVSPYSKLSERSKETLRKLSRQYYYDNEADRKKYYRNWYKKNRKREVPSKPGRSKSMF